MLLRIVTLLICCVELIFRNLFFVKSSLNVFQMPVFLIVLNRIWSGDIQSSRWAGHHQTSARLWLLENSFDQVMFYCILRFHGQLFQIVFYFLLDIKFS